MQKLHRFEEKSEYLENKETRLFILKFAFVFFEFTLRRTQVSNLVLHLTLPTKSHTFKRLDDKDVCF